MLGEKPKYEDGEYRIYAPSGKTLGRVEKVGGALSVLRGTVELAELLSDAERLGADVALDRASAAGATVMFWDEDIEDLIPTFDEMKADIIRDHGQDWFDRYGQASIDAALWLFGYTGSGDDAADENAVGRAHRGRRHRDHPVDDPNAPGGVRPVMWVAGQDDPPK